MGRETTWDYGSATPYFRFLQIIFFFPHSHLSLSLSLCANLNFYSLSKILLRFSLFLNSLRRIKIAGSEATEKKGEEEEEERKLARSCRCRDNKLSPFFFLSGLNQIKKFDM